MHVVWLARLDYEQDGFAVAAIRGVRHIWNGLEVVHTFKDAKAVVDRLISEPTQMVPVAQTEDYQQLHDLMVAAAEAHQGAAEFVIDPEDTTMPDPGQPDPDDEELTDDSEYAGPFSPSAYKTAMLLVNMGPNPQAACMHALALARATEDVSLYQEVVAAIADVFELPIELDVGDNGPQIHIYGEGGPGQS